jgi:hypothetical protein
MQMLSPSSYSHCFISPFSNGTAKKAEDVEEYNKEKKTPVTHVQVEGLLIKVRELHKAFAAKK